MAIKKAKLCDLCEDDKIAEHECSICNKDLCSTHFNWEEIDFFSEISFHHNFCDDCFDKVKEKCRDENFICNLNNLILKILTSQIDIKKTKKIKTIKDFENG